MPAARVANVADVPFRELAFLERDIEVDRRPDGALLVRSRVPLVERVPHVPHLLRRKGQSHPDDVWIAQRRGADREWHKLTYGRALREVDALTQALLDLRVDGRPLMVLSGNSPEHAVVELAAMQARMPYVPVTPAYATPGGDHAKLRAMVELVDPAVIFVQDATALEEALAGVAAGRLVVTVDRPTSSDQLVLADLLATTPTDAVLRSVEQIEWDTVAKYQFTSGSTGIPKAVIVTQRMLVTALASTSMLIAQEDGDPLPVSIDWLPWSHVAGGSAIFNRILEVGGTLYIDDGRPTVEEFGETLRNLGEISPTSFSSMPIGFGMLVEAMDADPELGRTFFAHLRRATYSGARLPDELYTRFQEHAVAHTGLRIPFGSGYGSTETTAACAFVYWPSERAGLIGLPQPGVELKLVPLGGDRFEVRVRSDTVTPGYLGQPDLSAQVRDEEGWYLMGDAATWVDPEDPREGLAYAGRVSEEFKLQSGTFVRVDELRLAVLRATSPLLRDVVVAGADQKYVALLAWPDLEACRQHLGEDGDPLTSEALRSELVARLAAYNEENPGSSTRVRRLLLMSEPPDKAAGEVSEKGNISQRAVLDRRQADVERLFTDPAPEPVIEIHP